MESLLFDSPDFFDEKRAQKLKDSLQDEEKRLGHLEKERIELAKELDKLEKEILEEKRKYRNLIDNKLTKELENIIKNQQEKPEKDSELCASNHQMRIEKIDLELSTQINFDQLKGTNIIDIPKTPKGDYIKSIKNFLSAKKSQKFTVNHA